MGYNARKAAETIAYFIIKSGSYQMNVLKAIKLVYLADRESLKQYGYPIQNEDRVSMPFGPVNSVTLNYMNNDSQLMKSMGYDGGWSDILTDRTKTHHLILQNRNLSVDDFDELSQADMDILDQIWKTFGHMDQFKLSDWTHNPENVPEWQDPQGSSIPISLLSILTAIGVENPEEQVEYIKESEEIDKFFDRI